MGEYTSCLSTKGYDISPEDENYKQELLDVVKSFRTFDAALDEFIVQKGYSGDIAEVDAKVKFIKEEFDKAYLLALSGGSIENILDGGIADEAIDLVWDGGLADEKLSK